MIALILLAMLAQTQNVEVEPVTCWWRTTATAVRVGEPFTVILTCSLLHTDAARVIADESRLEPAVVQLPPFEVMGGNRAKDLTTAGRRFVQFEYRLRSIAENAFASEVALPPLEISYRVESRVSVGSALAGRDRTYALPPLTMRVLSLVPDTADDIREAPVATFTEIQDIGSRAIMFRVAAAVLMTLGLLVLAFAVVGSVRARRASRPAAARTVPRGAILDGIHRDLVSIGERARSAGWTSDLAGRALAVTRIVAAYATGRPVSQRTVASSLTESPAGELVVRSRRGLTSSVSAAAATAEDEELRDALTRFAAARYGRNPSFDARLDEALAAVTRQAERLRAQRSWMDRLWPR